MGCHWNRAARGCAGKRGGRHAAVCYAQFVTTEDDGVYAFSGFGTLQLGCTIEAVGAGLSSTVSVSDVCTTLADNGQCASVVHDFVLSE